jgi:hypothetical protein
MKKLYALGALGVPLLLAATWMGTRTTTTQEPVALLRPVQQAPVRFASYGLESQHFAMDDMGSLLQRIGREIQQEERFTIGGTSYPLSGFGGVELGVNRYIRGDEARTGVELHFGSDGRTTTPVNRRTGEPQEDYDPYERNGRFWEASALADLIAELGETLASTGTIVLEHHRVPFRGAASIDQRLIESMNEKGNPYPYKLEVNVLFGEGEVEGPDDDDDYGEDQEYGLIRSLARAQQDGAGRNDVGQMFATLGENLRAGRIQVGQEALPVGELPVSFRLTHVTASDDSYDKIEFSLAFGLDTPPIRDPNAVRHYDEQFNEPITDLAAILQRLGAQILEDGTFELGGETFSAGRMASWDIGANPRGFSVEVTYHQPPER